MFFFEDEAHLDCPEQLVVEESQEYKREQNHYKKVGDEDVVPENGNLLSLLSQTRPLSVSFLFRSSGNMNITVKLARLISNHESVRPGVVEASS